MNSNPLYWDLYQKLMKAIKSGEYPENKPLPSEEKLCQKYNVSRTTLRRSLNLLQEIDVIYSVHGIGSFVKPRQYLQTLSTFYSFTNTLKNSNIIIQNTILSCEVVTADKSLAAESGYAEGTAFHKLLRLRSVKEYPLMLETTYLPQSRFLSLDTDILSNGSLYDFLRERYGFHADRAVEKFQPVFPRSEEKTLLHISSDVPCMLLERYSYEDEILIEYTKSIVRGDKYAFRVDLPMTDSSTAPE